jgi:DNA-binding beta-propeller fold protein YncE
MRKIIHRLVSAAVSVCIAVLWSVSAMGSELSGTVVVANQASDTITLIDLAAMEAYRHVAVVGGPHEVAVSPDGARVLVTNYNKRGAGPQKALSLVSLPDGATIRTIDLGEFSMPHDLQWVDDERVVVTAEANQALLLVNTRSGEVERVFETGKGGSHMLALSADRQRLYSSNMSGTGSVSVFDFATGAKLTDIDTGAECEGVGVSPDGRWVWAGNRAEDTVSIIDTERMEVVRTLESPGFPYRVEFTPDGSRALVPHARSGTLMVGDVAGQRVIKHLAFHRRGFPASRQHPCLRHRAQRQRHAHRQPGDRRKPGPSGDAVQPRRCVLLAASKAGGLKGWQWGAGAVIALR